MKRVLWVVGIMIVIVASGFAYFRINRIPIKHFDSSGWFFGRKWGSDAHEITPNPAVESVIWRARIDQFVAPLPRTHRILGPGNVQVERDEMYVFFPESLEAHSFVIYRVSNPTQRLLWKAVDSNPP